MTWLPRLALPCAMVACAAGCSVDTAGLDAIKRPIEAGTTPVVDAGALDAGAVDAARADAGSRDGGAGADDTGPGVDAFVPPACMAGPLRCSEDGTAVIACDDGAEDRIPCESGCDTASSSCRDVPTCPLAVEATLEAGDELRVDLCGGGNDLRNVVRGSCGYAAEGEDRLYRVVLDRPRSVWIDVKDVAGGTPVDTALYIRTDCDDPSSQGECSDDLACGEADPELPCVSGRKYGQSRIEATLDPGVYWVAIDSFDWNDGPTHYRCGEVIIRYRWP